MRQTVVVLIAFILALMCSGAARAHDHWLEVDPYLADKPGKDAPKVYQVMGKYFVNPEPMPVRRRAEYAQFRLIGPKGETDLLPAMKEDEQPLATLDAATGVAGTWIVALDGVPGEIELSAELFQTYLLEERLIDVLALRVERKQEDTPGRERYTRHMKALFQQGAATDAVATRAIGQDLEIVPLVNPYKVKAGKDATLTVQVLFHGKPLAGRAVTAHNRLRLAVTRQVIRTDKDGKATFKINRKGAWLFKLVHIEPSTEKDVDWRSYWATLTFAL